MERADLRVSARSGESSCWGSRYSLMTVCLLPRSGGSGQDLGGRRGLALRLAVDRAPHLRGRGVDAPDVHDFAEGAVLLGYTPLVERKRVRLLVGLLSGDVLAL